MSTSRFSFINNEIAQKFSGKKKQENIHQEHYGFDVKM